MSNGSNIDTSKLGYNSSQRKRAILIVIVILTLFGVGFYYNSTVDSLPKCNSTKVMNALEDMLIPGTTVKNPEQYDLDTDSLTRFCRVTLNDQIYSYKVNWYSENKDKIIVSFQ